jgi:hypothetical protein
MMITSVHQINTEAQPLPDRAPDIVAIIYPNRSLHIYARVNLLAVVSARFAGRSNDSLIVPIDISRLGREP